MNKIDFDQKFVNKGNLFAENIYFCKLKYIDNLL